MSALLFKLRLAVHRCRPRYFMGRRGTEFVACRCGSVEVNGEWIFKGRLW